MSADRQCLVCGNPMPGHDNSPACEACWDRLEQDLAELPALLDELEVVLARQDRVQKPPARRRYAPLEDDEEDQVDRDVPAWLRAEHQPRIKPRSLPLRLEAVTATARIHHELIRAVGPVLRDNPACRRRAVEGPPRRGERRPVTYTPLPAPRPLADSLAAARFLLSALAWMRTRPDQHEAIRPIRKAMKDAADLIDTADALVYCGICSTARPGPGGGCPGPDVCPCGCHDGHGNPCTIPGGCGLGQPATEPVICQEELYAVDHRHLTKRRVVDGLLEVDQHVCMGCAFIRCRTCGTRHDVDERRRLLLDAARDYLVTTTEACRAIATYADGNLKEATVWKWKERGRVVARGHTVENGARQDLYRLGDLMDLAAGTRRDTREGA